MNSTGNKSFAQKRKMHEVSEDPPGSILESDDEGSCKRVKMNQDNIFTMNEYEGEELSIPFSKIQINIKKSSKLLKDMDAQKLLQSIQSQGSEAHAVINSMNQDEEMPEKIEDKWTLIISGKVKTFKPLYKLNFHIKKHNPSENQYERILPCKTLSCKAKRRILTATINSEEGSFYKNQFDHNQECEKPMTESFWVNEEFLKLCESDKTPTAIIRTFNENKEKDKKIKDIESIRRKISAIKYLQKKNNNPEALNIVNVHQLEAFFNNTAYSIFLRAKYVLFLQVHHLSLDLKLI